MADNHEQEKVLASVAALILIVAITVLVIDWQIKNAILAEAKRFRGQVQGYERKYWNGQTVDSDFDSATVDGNSSDSGVVVGITGVAEGTDPAEDASSSWDETPVKRSTHLRAGKHHLAVPEGD